MKKIFISLIIICSLIGSYSCQDAFLQKPDTSGTVDLDRVFSTSKNAEGALARCYLDVLKHGWPSGWGVGHGVLGSISGEISKGYNWHGTWFICDAGLSVTGSDGSDAGADSFSQNWEYIRECFVVMENIDKVVDMDETMKAYIKGETTGLIAYRYMGMFYRYGGLPIVRKAFTVADDLEIPRASLQEMLDYIIELCDEAIAALPNSWENIEAGKYIGRLTKGAVMAMKARALQFAARPLFNSASPVIEFSNRENNEIICFGSADPNRWQTAITANEAVLTWAAANGYELINTGGAGVGQPNPNAADDYGTACSAMRNREVLLAYKRDDSGGSNYISYYYNTSNYWSSNRYDTDNVGMLTNFLENYYNVNGDDMDWPKIGEAEPRPIQDFLDNINMIEPRFRIDVCVPGLGTLSNVGDGRWQPDNWGRNLTNFETRAAAPSARFPEAADVGKGCGFSCKFYYRAGSRVWFEPPLFRMAEIYLNLAEAYNEANNPVKALENLNMVHNRAGLPAITETNKDLLRQIIWREKAIEYFNENHRYFDVKHWKHPEIGTNIIGGSKREMQMRRSASGNLTTVLIEYWDSFAYDTFWHPKMFLEPIPQSEINKGIIVQNPGY